MPEMGLTVDAKVFTQVIVGCYKARMLSKADYYVKPDLNQNLIIHHTKFFTLIRNL
jgi:hypothetical protein